MILDEAHEHAVEEENYFVSMTDIRHHPRLQAYRFSCWAAGLNRSLIVALRVATASVEGRMACRP